MSIEYSVCSEDGSELRGKGVVQPGDVSMMASNLIEDKPNPPMMVRYGIFCREDNSGGQFIEERLNPYNENEILESRIQEILNGEAGEWELNPQAKIVFRHSSDSVIDIPSAFYE